ncbi:MAG: energy-coupling factor transporter transmembrane protein EcfT [Syntrophobacterales bacterium]|nr:energy-coupling factor transporter transmembrane protein EcfT [Syntrophobacterales bacterium]
MISLGQYLPDDTLLHRLDPRVKIVSVVALSLLIFGATAVEIPLISAFLVAIVVAARMTPARVLEALRPVLFFLALIFLVHLLFTAGTPLFTLAPLPLRITKEGLLRGLYVTWQFASLILAAALLTLTTAPSALVGGIERLLRPLSRVGIPSQDLALMIAMALRFVPLLLEEYEQLRMAQMARGADFTTGGLVPRGRAVVALVVPLLLSAFRRADEFALAMEARGYQRGGVRTTLCEFTFFRHDLGAFAVLVALIIVTLFLRFAAS